MAMATTSRTAFINKLQKRATAGWGAAKAKAAKPKGQRLPGTIVGGIAKLTLGGPSTCKLDKKGNPYFRFGGGVISPPECFGIQATVFHSITANKNKTIDDKLDGLSSDLQLIGLDLDQIDIGDVSDALAELVAAGETYILFNTWQPDPTRDSFVFIQGIADPAVVADAIETAGQDVEIVDDDTSDEASTNDSSNDADDGWKANDRCQVMYEGVPWLGTVVSQEGDAVTITFDDNEATEEHPLADVEAIPAEASDEEVSPPAELSAEIAVEAADGGWQPEKEEIYGYKPPNQDQLDVSVIGVDISKQTVTLKSDAGKVYRNISWGNLKDAS